MSYADEKYAAYVARQQTEGKQPKPFQEWAAIPRVASLIRKAANPDHLVVTPPTPVPEEHRAALDAALTAEREGLHGDPQPSPNDQENDPLDEARAVAAQLNATPETAEERVRRLSFELAQAQADLASTPQEDLRANAEAEAEKANRWIFHSENRMGAVVLSSSSPSLVNGHYIPGRHVVADFSNYRWVTEDRDQAYALMASDSYKRGEVFLVPEGAMAPPAAVGVQTGPRTSQSVNLRQSQASDRPRGALSTTIR